MYKFTPQEIKGLIQNAISTKTVWIAKNGSRMDSVKTKETPVQVDCHKITSDRISFMTLVHVGKAIQNGGTLVRTIKGNPIAVVVVRG